MNVADARSTGAPEMSWFHQLSDGNNCRPWRSPSNCAVDGADAVGAGAVDAVGEVGEAALDVSDA